MNNLEYIKKWNKEHPEKVRAYSRKWLMNNRERARETTRKWAMNNRARLAINKRNNIATRKMKIIKLLGGKCAVCRLQDVRCLQIDHVNGDGYKDRNDGKGNDQYYRKVLKKIQSGSKDYQLLCANHNWIKRCEMNEINKRKY